MMLSVIIPTCNRNDLLSKCLDRLAPETQTVDGQYEVIITDDSKDNLAKSLIEEKYTWAKWIPGPKQGPAANRNNGAKHATGEWLVFIDDDCLPQKNILNEYKQSISSYPDILAYEGRIYVDDKQTSFLQESPVNNTGGYFWSCNICIQKLAFEKVGGFDSNFPFAAMEDVDFFMRLKINNIKNKFLYDAAVIHPWRTNQKLFRTTLNRYQSHLYYISKYPEERKRMSYKYFLRAFINFSKYTFRNAIRFRFSGFAKKVCADFLQLYFALRILLGIEREYR
ncbi:MAG: glycosyltransferase [Mucilaginibacter sp.]|uniref:glycosyltransferase family 2 protein n=1 Tax=Mucilaginibacter sp. TaxID=1882438 RepID=UPI0032666BF1